MLAQTSTPESRCALWELHPSFVATGVKRLACPWITHLTFSLHEGSRKKYFLICFLILSQANLMDKLGIFPAGLTASRYRSLLWNYIYQHLILLLPCRGPSSFQQLWAEQQSCVQVTTLLPKMGASWKHYGITSAFFFFPYAKYHTIGGPWKAVTAATELDLPLSFLSTLRNKENL